MLTTVTHRHRRQLQVFTTFARQREANQAATELGHEIDGFGRHVVGREHQIAFVFAVFLVHQDDHAASGKFGYQLGNGRDR